ncbi:thioredoxin-like protein [Rhodocollybia butyracea]|uniref:Glutathione peroxidase n=1 Tax=Rhodocollybia butyracea TaxID=206335 RepID=A0A9P5PEQ6_9AGAR|nr:thioredoxin-like protein [Rhodocollybia butyracea]
MSEKTGFYSLQAEMPGNKTLDFADLKGKVILIVNTASACGFTPQYKGLQALYDKYKDNDFTILGFPCNQSDVNGDSTNEVYKFLKSEKSGILGLSRIKWNFEKFLIDKQGNVVQRWASTTTPQAIDAEIAKLVT